MGSSACPTADMGMTSQHYEVESSALLVEHVIIHVQRHCESMCMYDLQKAYRGWWIPIRPLKHV